jgi:5-methylcytosine-specific restriction endonuclease McrA
MSYQVNRFRNQSKRTALFLEDGNRCAYCLVDFNTLPQRLQTVDHITPRSAGGTNALDNLLSACHGCNSKRGDQPLHEWVGPETLVRLIRDYPRVSRTIVETMTRKAA